jgi:hypothetical protein
MPPSEPGSKGAGKGKGKSQKKNTPVQEFSSQQVLTVQKARERCPAVKD